MLVQTLWRRKMEIMYSVVSSWEYSVGFTLSGKGSRVAIRIESVIDSLAYPSNRVA